VTVTTFYTNLIENPLIFSRNKKTKGNFKMANSKLLKEAIADAKAVRETAIANAKIALEEAFTPRLQSILSQKLQQEMEDEEEAEVNEEYSDGSEAPTEDASDIGDGDNKQPADDANSSSDVAQGNPDTDVETAETGKEDENSEVVAEGEYNEDGEEEITAEGDEEEEISEDEDELDLESIIRELEDELSQEEDELEEEDGEEESHEEEAPVEEPVAEEEGEESEEGDDSDEEIDLEEILREMGYGEEEEVEESEEEDSAMAEKEAELEEAYKVIKTLKKTINEVNLLNAKLLYTNKLFRSYDLTNEQKHKVVETLDRTGNVREVKLVFSTLAESFRFTGTTKKQKASKINESFASKPVASTAPKKEVITESTNAMADRFKKLANIR
jgi:hypothetical protein